MNIEDDLGSADLGEQPSKHQKVRHVVHVHDVIPPPGVEEANQDKGPREEGAVFEGIAG